MDALKEALPGCTILHSELKESEAVEGELAGEDVIPGGWENWHEITGEEPMPEEDTTAEGEGA